MAMTGSVLFLIAVFLGWQGMNASRTGFEQLSTASQVHLLNLARIAGSVRDNYAEVLLAFQHAPESHTAAIHSHPTSMHLEAIAGRRAGFEEAWNKIKNSKLEEDEKHLADDIAAKRAAWGAKVQAAVDAIKAGDFSPETQAAFLKAGREEGKALLAALDKMIEFQVNETKTTSEAEEALFKKNMMIFTVLLIVGIVGVLGTAWLTIRHINSGLNKASAAAEAIANGDLTQAVPSAGHDEIGQLLQRLGTMRDNLNQLIRSIRGNVDSLNTSAQELSSAANVDAGNTEMQAEAASGMAASVEQLWFQLIRSRNMPARPVA